MRRVLTHILVVFAVTSLGAAQQQGHSESKAASKTVSSHRPHAARAKKVRAGIPGTKRTAKPVRAATRAKHGPFQVGRASWYGKHFHGRKTASGEPYNMFQFTAAHPALPLGTMVKVTNLRNNLWVIVRINDRGPVPKSRIIDLSYGAAQMLQLRARGVERVRLDLVQPEIVASASGGPIEIAGIQ
jgi:rare lipoprotein A (peptidoglycan hydrolase)